MQAACEAWFNGLEDEDIVEETFAKVRVRVGVTVTASTASVRTSDTKPNTHPMLRN